MHTIYLPYKKNAPPFYVQFCHLKKMKKQKTCKMCGWVISEKAIWKRGYNSKYKFRKQYKDSLSLSVALFLLHLWQYCCRFSPRITSNSIFQQKGSHSISATLFFQLSPKHNSIHFPVKVPHRKTCKGPFEFRPEKKGHLLIWNCVLHHSKLWVEFTATPLLLLHQNGAFVYNEIPFSYLN